MGDAGGLASVDTIPPASEGSADSCRLAISVSILPRFASSAWRSTSSSEAGRFSLARATSISFSLV